MTVRGVRLVVAYDGTRFSGFVVQPGLRTVAGELGRAIEAMTGKAPKLRVASRTDAGVHAEAQVTAFDTESTITLHKWVTGMNRHLDDDCAVRSAEECAPGYEPRFDTTEKTYRYLLTTRDTRIPRHRFTAWHLGPQLTLPRDHPRAPLDLDAMREAARALIGTHDFRAFRSAADERENTVRSLYAVDVEELEPELVAITVRGNAFMHNMMRILVGTLVEVGRHREDVGRVAAMLGEHAERESAGPTAPAHGLTLMAMKLGR